MRFIEEYIEQRSPEWLALHRGVITASRAIGLSTPARRKTFAMELAHESLSHTLPERGVSNAMAEGIMAEPEIKQRYSFLYDGEFRDIGFAWHVDLQGIAGCSPDMICEDLDRVVELKRREGLQIMRNMVDGPKPEDLWQIQFSLFVLDADHAHYVDTAPHMQPPYDFCVTEVGRDRKIFDALPKYVEEVADQKREFIALAEQRFGSGEVYQLKETKK